MRISLISGVFSFVILFLSSLSFAGENRDATNKAILRALLFPPTELFFPPKDVKCSLRIVTSSATSRKRFEFVVAGKTVFKTPFASWEAWASHEIDAGLTIELLATFGYVQGSPDSPDSNEVHEASLHDVVVLPNGNLSFGDDEKDIFLTSKDVLNLYRAYHCDEEGAEKGNEAQAEIPSAKPAASPVDPKIDTCAMIGIYHSMEDGSDVLPRKVQQWVYASYAALRGTLKNTDGIEEECRSLEIAPLIHERQDKILKDAILEGNGAGVAVDQAQSTAK